jgi:hypothetical protein
MSDPPMPDFATADIPTALVTATSMPPSTALFPPQHNSVIGGVDEVLAGPQMSFGSLGGGVAEQELDVFEFAAGGVNGE